MASDTYLLRAAKSLSSIGLSQLVTYALAFSVSVVVAANFGTSRLTDAYFMATSTAELLSKILLGGALTSVTLPVFVEFLTKGEPRRAWELFSALFSLSLFVFVLLGGLFELFAGPIIAFVAPGFPEHTQELTVLLLRIVLPAYLFSFLADLAMVPLHAHRRFGIASASRLVVPLLTLLAILALARHLGIVTFAVGTLIGTLFQVSMLLTALRKSGYRFRMTLNVTSADVRRVVRLTLPFAVSILAAHGAGIVYRILVSREPEGALASLKFGEKIFQITNFLFLSTVSQVAFPSFARAAAISPEDMRARLKTAVGIVAFLSIPLTVGVILLREPLVRTLYERGAFTSEATRATAVLVPFFVVGLLGNGVSSLLGHAALALQATRISVWVNIALQTIAAGLFLLVTPSLGVKGLALVSGIGPFMLTALYTVGLRRRIPNLGTIFTATTGVKLLLAGAACAVLVTMTLNLLRPMQAGPARDLGMLGGGAIAGLLGYLGAAWLLRVPEVNTARDIVRHALRPIRKA